MDYKYEIQFNDKNGVTEDGRGYKVHRLNPDFGKEGEPEFIDVVLTAEQIVEDEKSHGRDCTVEDVQKAFAIYKEDQESWATATERYEDTHKRPIAGIDLRDGENPMDAILALQEDDTFNPERILDMYEKMDDEKRIVMITMLAEFIGELSEDWQQILFRMYNMNQRFSDMVREDEAKTGEKKSNQSYSKKHKKAIDYLKDKFEAAGYEVDRTPKRKKKA